MTDSITETAKQPVTRTVAGLQRLVDGLQRACTKANQKLRGAQDRKEWDLMKSYQAQRDKLAGTLADARALLEKAQRMSD